MLSMMMWLDVLTWHDFDFHRVGEVLNGGKAARHGVGAMIVVTGLMASVF